MKLEITEYDVKDIMSLTLILANKQVLKRVREISKAMVMINPLISNKKYEEIIKRENK